MSTGERYNMENTTPGLCSCFEHPVRWQFTSTKLGIFGGGILFLGLLVGSYLTTWILR